MNFDFINNNYIDFIDQMPGLLMIAKLDATFITGNKTAVEWTGLKARDDLYGKIYGDIPAKISEKHDTLLAQDVTVLKNSNGYGKFFGLYCYNNDEWRIVVYEKYPLKNKNGEMAALVTYVSDMTHANIIDINKFVTLTNYKDSIKLCSQQQGFIIDGNPTKITLTARQTECLFFLLRGKTAKEISISLKLSPRTVELFTEQLKIKFECQNKSELIAKAIELGYMNVLPKSMFNLFK